MPPKSQNILDKQKARHLNTKDVKVAHILDALLYLKRESERSHFHHLTLIITQALEQCHEYGPAQGLGSGNSPKTYS